MSVLDGLILGSALCFLLMGLSWALATRIGFYSLVDAVWAYGLGGLGLFYALILEGDPTKRALAAGMALLWGLRLGTHLGRRLWAHYPAEDGRYRELRKNWGAGSFFLFYQFQGFSQIVFGLPFLILASDPSPGLSLGATLGAAVFALGLIGESIADSQLRRFRQSAGNSGLICEQGLWHYSRHPNYFFEWLVWCGIAIAALGSPLGPLGLISPLLMYLTLNHFTGVPALEAQALRSKGNAYKDYQRRTSRFFPWKPLDTQSGHPSQGASK